MKRFCPVCRKEVEITELFITIKSGFKRATFGKDNLFRSTEKVKIADICTECGVHFTPPDELKK